MKDLIANLLAELSIGMVETRASHILFGEVDLPNEIMEEIAKGNCNSKREKKLEVNMKKVSKRIIATVVAMSMFFVSGINTYAYENEKNIDKKEYLVMTKNSNEKDKTIDKYKNIDDKNVKKLNDNNICYVKMTQEQAKKLENEKNIESVEQNIVIKGAGEEIDPDIVTDNWNLEIVNANQSDNSNENDTEKIKIAIIDSGVDLCEEIDVKERYNLVPEEEGVLPIYDDMTGHGTAIAGIIAGKSVEGRYAKGINSNVELYSIKVLDGENSAPLNRLVEGIYKAIEYDVDIINLSLGTTINSKILHKAIIDANNAGILIVAAAGNRGKSDGIVEYPAAYKEVLSVGAIDSNADISETSSYGDKVDVVAPGELIKTVANFGMETVSSGTSMAAPHVVGIASVLWQKDKTKDADFIRNLIEDSANSICKDSKNYNLVDMEYAIKMYDEYATNNDILENDSEIEIDDEMSKVTAKWSRDNHEALVSNLNGGKATTKQLNLIKLGIRYNDNYLMYKKDESDKVERDIWHSLNADTNYMAAVYYVGKVIQNASVTPSGVAKPNGLTNAQYSKMIEDINVLKTDDRWNKALDNYKISYKKNNDNIRCVLFGMSLHIITDAFAHRTYKRKDGLSGRNWTDWEHVSPTDDINQIPNRYNAAGKVVNNAFQLVLNSSNIRSSYTIRSKHIMYNNNYFDGSFLMKDLVFMAESNSGNDSTYQEWRRSLAANTWTDDVAKQQRMPELLQ